ncbi:MAG: response regulator transcription factor [Treponema sp.]|jgi:DNA-binding NarL/FixJ family response regulator|nr:response regulator transcription factor [Treponema sp.]
MIRIVIIDGKESEQQRVQATLAFHSDFEVVGHGKDGFDALTLVGKLTPDIMIMDTRLSDTNGIKLIPLLKSKSPYTAYLILTSLAEEAHLTKIINLGITAYLLKETDMDTLPLAIRTLYTGGHFFSPKVHDKVFHTLLDIIKTNKAADTRSSLTDAAWPKGLGKARSQKTVNVKFSAAEQRLISLVVQGYSNEEIAERLSLRGGTVRNYLSAMIQKTGQRNRTQLVVFALNNGLLPQSRN